MVVGFWPTVLLGVLGGLITELIRIGGAFRADKPPAGRQYLASAIFTLLGAGAVLYGWNTEQPALEVATVGAAFPLLFSAATSALTSPPGGAALSADRRQPWRVADWIAWRFYV
jgi:hypothetical protein